MTAAVLTHVMYTTEDYFYVRYNASIVSLANHLENMPFMPT